MPARRRPTLYETERKIALYHALSWGVGVACWMILAGLAFMMASR